MTTPELPETELLQSWITNASAWTHVVRTGAIPSRRLGTDAAILEHVRALRPSTVLDVGCGEGWLARALSGDGFTVTGVDGSAALIENAQTSGGGTFQCIGYDELIADPHLVPGPFDCIVCNFSLLAEDLAPLLRALGHRLAAGGRLVIQTVHPFSAKGDAPYASGWRREDFSSFDGSFPASMPWYYRTISSWIAELRAAELDLVSASEPLNPDTGMPLSLLLSLSPM